MLRFVALLMSGFGVLSLTLAAVGVYGLVAFSVSQRRRELGIRLAVGATPRSIRRLVVGEMARLTAFGIVIGALACGLAARSFGSLLYGVDPWDPASYLSAAAVLACVALGEQMGARRERNGV